MKKIFFTFVSLLCLISTATAADRAHTLKIYNWADYIDEESLEVEDEKGNKIEVGPVLEEFKKWYKEQTGEDVEIIYQTFDVNEIMLAKIEIGKEDFDVVCPSEYIIERMLRKDLLQPIETDFGDTPNYLKHISPYIIERFSKIDGSGKNANDYAVGYMWGTTGILYNTKYVTREEASTWKVFHNHKFKNRIFIKDAFRDVYSTILIYLRQQELKDGTITLEELLKDSSDQSIADVEAFLTEAKPLVAGWEADFGKEMMTQEKAYINLTWSGDASWAIEEAAAVGVSLDYVVPNEGSNVWFDGWVIPKYAKNTKAARYFINFMCRPDIATRNMNYTGYVSVIASPEVFAEQSDDELNETVDASYFFGEGAEKAKLDPVMYPDKAVIERCAMMHDSGDRTPKMLEMWTRIKQNDIPLWIWIVIALSFGSFTFLYIRHKVLISRKKSHRLQHKSKRK